MSRCLTATLVVLGLVTLTSRDAAAQSDKDIAAYAGLNGTTVGALSPIMVSTGTKGEKPFNSIVGRYSHYSPNGGGDGNNQFGATWFHKAGTNAAVAGTVGYLAPGCTGCDGVMMASADVHSTLWNSVGSPTVTSVNLQGSLGYGHDPDITYLSLAVGVPLAISMEQASKARVGLFVTPGYGWGRISATGASENGALPMVGAGGSWTSAAGWGLQLSYNKVFVSNVSGNNMGLGFTWKM